MSFNMEAKLYTEILEEFDKAPNRAEKIAVLRKHDHPRLREFFTMVYNPGFEFDVQIPEYRPANEPAGLNYVYLEQEMSQIYKYISNHPAKPVEITPQRQRELLVVTLESLHRDEAELLANMFKKSIKVRGLNAKIVKEAFPDLPFEA